MTTPRPPHRAGLFTGLATLGLAAAAVGALTGDADAQGIKVSGDRPAQVPEEYLVEQGDTLWDICAYYFDEPWRWPTVWALNPHITNPHWIYPGDILRLRRGEGTGPQPVGVVVDPFEYTIGASNARQVSINEGFIAEEPLDPPGTLAFSPHAYRYVSLDDLVYLEMEDDELQKIRVGDRFSVYHVMHDVIHPDTGQNLGQKIRINGVVEVETVEKNVARARIVAAFNEMERGQPVVRELDHYAVVAPRQNLIDLQGTVVDALPPTTELAQFDTIFIDRGEKDGVQIGNRVFVMRRGDGRLDLDKSVEQKLPWEQIGEALIVATRDRTATAILTRTALEVRRGDRIVMQRHY
ncbi:MAG: LysM domain-containing protein [bacterium]